MDHVTTMEQVCINVETCLINIVVQINRVVSRILFGNIHTDKFTALETLPNTYLYSTLSLLTALPNAKNYR